MNRLLLISSNIYFFLAGVFVSVAVNLYTGLLSADTRPVRWIQISIAVTFTLVSALIWSVLAWQLEERQGTVGATTGSFGDRLQTWSIVLSGKRGRLIALFWGAVITAVIGLAALSIDVRPLAGSKPVPGATLPLTPTATP